MYVENRLNAMELPSTGEEILGIFLKDPSLFKDYRNKLTSVMFAEYKWLFDIMIEVDQTEEMNFRSIAGRCREQIELLHQLRNSVATTSLLPNLVTKLKKEHLNNRIQDIVRTTFQKSSEGQDPDEVLRQLQQESFALTTTETDGVVDPDQDVEEWHEWINGIMDDPSKALGMMTGLDEMDRLTTGWHRTDFIVIGARTSMGKSAFMLENVLRLTKAGYKCAIFSLEMTKRQIYNRMMANLMGVSLEIFRTGQLAKERRNEIDRWKELLKSVYVDDSRGVSADYITDSMRQLKRTTGLDFVVVDYLQDVKEQGEHNDNSGSALARVCRKLRAGAKESHCAIMGLSQVSRAVEERQDKRPSIADLSGSTGIETSADVIGMLYRDEYYNQESALRGILEVNFGKQRNGKVGKVELVYVKDYQRIVNFERSAVR